MEVFTSIKVLKFNLENLPMDKKCPNCNSIIINQDLTPKLVEILELFYGEHWDSEIQDIAMEICSICGTLPELLEYIEKELEKGKTQNLKNVIEEFDDNLHIPFLLQIAAPVFVFIIDNSTPSIQKAAIDELGAYGDEDSIGRFILSHQSDEIRILGIRALERIAKHDKKRGKQLDWNEYIDYMIGDDFSLIAKIKKKLNSKNFVKESTVEVVMPILIAKEEKLNPSPKSLTK